MGGRLGSDGPPNGAKDTVDLGSRRDAVASHGLGSEVGSEVRSGLGPKLSGSSPFDWMADRAGDEPSGPSEGRVAERLALARVTQGLIGRQRWPELGRYEIVRRLGKGAFGSVLLARDPDLDRDVAIKIVSLPSGDHAAARGRVTREARALAALTHPGVVQVYDFGLVEDAMCRDAHGDPGALFIVMEYLRGDSLRAWLTDNDGLPPIPEVFRVFDRVAAALASVHAAGLVHRDVKPDNIMLTHDGVPKLVDFGLVRTQGAAGSAELEATEPMAQLMESFGDSLSDGTPSVDEPGTPPHGTALGTVLGTPQYMAPEQHEGRLATESCDQFAVAAALFEALSGRMPFGGGDLEALLTRKLTGELPEPHRPIDPAVLAVVRRGLSPDPGARFATVEEFRQALAVAAAPRRRSRWAIALTGVLALTPLLAVWGGSFLGSGADVPCPTGPLFADLETIVPPVTGKDTLASWADLAEDLEVYGERWDSARQSVCEAASSVDADTQSRRVACLEHAAVHARTWLDAVLPSGGLTTAEARRHVDDLPDPAACTDAEDDLRGLNDERRAEVAAIERQLHALEARIRVNVTPETVQRAVAALQQARETGHLPLLAHALDVTGRLQLDLGDYADADVTLTEAAWTSLSAQRASRAALLMPRLMYAREQATGPAGFDELIPLAQRVLDEADAPPALRARVGVNIGFNLLGRSRFDEAEQRLREVKAMLEEAGSTVTTDYGETLTALSAVARNQGRMDDALDLATTALAVLEEADGPTASTTAFAHERVGAVHHSRGELKEAARQYETAIRLIEGIYGPQHPDLAWPRLILAVLWADEGRLDEAAEAADWAMEAAEASVGETSEMISVMTFNRSVIAEKRGNLDKALALMNRSRDISVRVAGAEGPDVASADRRIGELLLALKRPADATTPLERAWSTYARLDQPQDVAECRWYLAQAYDALGRRDDAEVHARAALDALPPDAEERAEVQPFVAAH